MPQPEYPDGIDCVWIAADQSRNVAAFVTAGSGAIPSSVLNSSVIPVVDVEMALAELPVVSAAQMLIDVKRPDDFIDMATRGLFVYDWQDVHRTAQRATHAYEPICDPVEAVKLDVLPEALRQLLESAVLPVASFAERQALDVSRMVTCVDPAGD